MGGGREVLEQEEILKEWDEIQEKALVMKRNFNRFLFLPLIKA